MEEPALLLPVQRIIGRIQVKDDLPGRGGMGLEEQLHQQPIDRCRIRRDLLVPVTGRGLRHAELKPVQRARPRQRKPPVARPPAPLPGHVPAPARQRQHAVRAQTVVVVQVLVARRQTQHPLGDQRLQTMLDQQHRPVVPETARQTLGHPEPPVNLPQQQHPTVRRQPTAVEPAHHRAAAETFKTQLGRDTLVWMPPLLQEPFRAHMAYTDLRSCIRPVDAIAHRKDRWP